MYSILVPYFLHISRPFFRKDSFTVTSGAYLGRLTKIRIGHDNTGFGAAWFLDKVSCLAHEESIVERPTNVIINE